MFPVPAIYRHRAEEFRAPQRRLHRSAEEQYAYLLGAKVLLLIMALHREEAEVVVTQEMDVGSTGVCYSSCFVMVALFASLLLVNDYSDLGRICFGTEWTNHGSRKQRPRDVKVDGSLL